MITSIRTGTPTDFKLAPAMAWAVKVAQYINDLAGTNVKAQRNVGGVLNEIHWITTYESLAKLETVTQTVEADAGYQKLVADMRSEQLFVPNSFRDRIYTSIG